jgi:hypothetical protein
MNERDSDIEFDFFDEPATEEAPQRSRIPGRPATGGPRGPSRPPAGMVPILRLIGLVAVAIAAVVVLVLVIQGCRDSGREEAYRGYVDDMRVVARGSAAIGTRFNTLLTTRGIRQPELQRQLGALAAQHRRLVDQALLIEPPGRIRQAHADAVQALGLRTDGLVRLDETLRQSGQATPAVAGARLAAQVRRFVASDVTWDDFWLQPVRGELDEQDIGGVNVPDSNFLANVNLTTPELMESIIKRVRGAATGGVAPGLHGTGLISVMAQPGNETLSANQENTVETTPELAIAVTVENTGDNQETEIPVTLSIEQSPTPIRRQQEIDLIDPGQRKTVVFRNLADAVEIAQKTVVRVEVTAVEGETRTQNNTAEYSVIFSLPPP